MNKSGFLPLKGIRVVDLTTYIAAPICGRLMADMGADVVKIESPGNDVWRYVAKAITNTELEENPVFDVYNAGKRCIKLNLKTPAGLTVMKKLLDEADVFITNVRQQSLKKLGLDGETLTAQNPRLIYATMIGYGELGPKRNDPGFDGVCFFTETGFKIDMATKSEGSYPILGTGIGIGDNVAGSTLFGEVMLALYNRERTKKGDYVSTSLYNAGIWTFCGDIIAAQKKYGAKYPKERTDYSPFDTMYKCADGEWISVVFSDYERVAPRFYKVTGTEAFVERLGVATYDEALEKSGEIIGAIDEAMKQKTSGEWLKILAEADIVCGLGKHFSDVSESEQAWINHYLQNYTCRNGSTCVMPVPPYRLASRGSTEATMAPLPGEHTDEVLEQLGYTKEDIAAMHENGVV